MKKVYLVERGDGYALKLFTTEEVAKKWAKMKGEVFRDCYEVVEMTVYETFEGEEKEDIMETYKNTGLCG